MSFPKIDDNRDLLSYLKEETSSRLGKEGLVPIRVSVTDSSDSIYHCEVGALHTVDSSSFEEAKLVFHFRKRRFENTKDFNVVFLIPTGIGCEIGGHAGDATPVARLLSSTCDNLITHPNVYNASDLNEMSDNSLYVEGSTISRLMMGTVGLQPVRCNRILAVIDNSDYSFFETAAVNSVNAARAVLGIVCSDIVKLDPSIVMKSRYSSSERAVGAIDGIDNLFAILKSYEGTYDAVAISTTIDVPKSYHTEYFRRRGDMVNPWGGVEAMLTHAISYKLNIPSAHSPMFESPQIANEDPGIVEARMSAEAVSTTFLHCVLKGLHKSPKIITDQDLFGYDDIISAENISCLVIPNGCLGLPTLAALKQGIKVIAVKENKNLMRNDLNELPWKSQQFFQVENYLEAAGVLSSIKNGIDTRSVRRPFKTMDFDNSDTSNDLVHQRPILKRIYA
ncbi:MAG: DUF3326 domain-containing protein [Bacteroidetes bacterium]|nr:DUF3326 domain-containing protein [Bacteroidota bacterium]